MKITFNLYVNHAITGRQRRGSDIYNIKCNFYFYKGVRPIDLYSEMFIDDLAQEKIIKEKIKENKEKSKALQALKFEAENKAEILKIKKDNLRNISYLLEKIGEGIEKLEDWEWKRIIDKLVDKIEIDSIGGQDKTVKLDIYITYNFDKIVSEKPSYYTNQVLVNGRFYNKRN